MTKRVLAVSAMVACAMAFAGSSPRAELAPPEPMPDPPEPPKPPEPEPQIVRNLRRAERQAEREREAARDLARLDAAEAKRARKGAKARRDALRAENRDRHITVIRSCSIPGAAGIVVDVTNAEGWASTARDDRLPPDPADPRALAAIGDVVEQVKRDAREAGFLVDVDGSPRERVPV